MTDARRQSGLSLVEMLVVMMVAGFALMLATQSLGQWQRAQQRIGYTTQLGREQRLIESWWLASARGQQAVAETPFEGDARGFRGVSLQPVLLPAGTPAATAWRLDEQPRQPLALVLEEGGRHLALTVAEAEDARFTYLDHEGETHPQWPPALGLHPMLPAAIGLDYLDARTGSRRLWLASIAGPAKPTPTPFEPESD